MSKLLATDSQTEDQTARSVEGSAHCDTPSIDELEALFVNNEKLNKIKAHFNQFNPIKVMKMERMEIRHSNILAWLLDPMETHGFGDEFLRSFLSEAMRGQSSAGSPTALDITRADLRQMEIRREWQNIDLCLICSSNNWAFIVENKFYSKQHDGQLNKYINRSRELLSEIHPGIEIKGIFLTLYEEAAEEPSFSPISYEFVLGLLRSLIDQYSNQISQEVRTFINHYIGILAEETGVSEDLKEMEQLARELYLEHKKALDFIWEYGSGSDFSIAVDSVFGEGLEFLNIVDIDGEKFVYSEQNNYQVSFLPYSWYLAMGADRYDWEGCESWWAGYPVICWLSLQEQPDGSKGKLRLYAEVGPVNDQDNRAELIEEIRAIAESEGLERIKFNNSAADPGRRFSKFFKQSPKDITDISDSEEIANAIKIQLKKFRKEFAAIAKVLPKVVEFGVPAE